MKIGILTWLYNENYGSILQAYALQKYLTDLGHDVYNINYKPTNKEKLLNLVKCKNSPTLFIEKWKIYSTKRKCPHKKELRNKTAKFSDFRINNFNLTKLYETYDEIEKIEEKCDIYICGSDQIWSPMLLNPIYYFSFLPSSSMKISYACSFGMNFIPKKKQKMIKDLLEKFEAISVRENEGKRIVKELIGKDTPVLVDPTFLLSENEWNKIVVTPKPREPYIFCYFLTNNKNYCRISKAVATKLNTNIVIIASGQDFYSELGDVIYDAGPQEWLGLIKNATAVITDSFHGCIFSIVFQKQLFVLKRFNDLDPKSQNSRIYTLLGKYDMLHCIINEKNLKYDNYVDYNLIYNMVSNDILESKQWLHNQTNNMDIVQKDYSKTAFEVIGEKECVGCGCCSLICPSKCITMNEDAEGFMMPFIDQKSCIKCGKCIKYCPVLHSKLKKNDEVYAATLKDNNKLCRCTSGGVFNALAEYIILRKKGVVYGVVYKEDLVVGHKRADNIEILKAMNGSKYVQSDAFLCFDEILSDLKNGKYVLFSGTGCQIAALYNYIDNSVDKLITIEIVCHGVPAPGLYKKYLNWISKTNKGATISNYKFRSKDDRTSGGHYKASFSINGRTKKVFAYADPFYASFLRGRTVRKSCYNCHFKGNYRIGDITIGDFWGIEKISKTFPASRGVSVVLLNSNKGIELFDKIKDQFYLLKTQYNDAIAYNSAISLSTVYDGQRYDLSSNSLFDKDLRQRHTIKVIIKNHIPQKLKVVMKRYLR